MWLSSCSVANAAALRALSNSVAISERNAAWRALAGSRERTKEKCQLCGVDDAVVWTAPVK
jgi:6-phosphofructokinase